MCSKVLGLKYFCLKKTSRYPSSPNSLRLTWTRFLLRCLMKHSCRHLLLSKSSLITVAKDVAHFQALVAPPSFRFSVRSPRKWAKSVRIPIRASSPKARVIPKRSRKKKVKRAPNLFPLPNLSPPNLRPPKRPSRFPSNPKTVRISRPKIPAKPPLLTEASRFQSLTRKKPAAETVQTPELNN